jgi:hypothetical protein
VYGKRLTSTAAVLGAFVAVTLPTAPAGAQACVPQSTVAALDQYCASLPSSDGGSQPVGGGSARPLSASLPQREVSKLRASGMAGQALLSVPSGAPLSNAAAERAVHSLPATRRAVEQARREERSAGAGSLGAAARALATEAPDVLGGAFRWGLTISTFGIAAMAWLRFRGRIKL